MKRKGIALFFVFLLIVFVGVILIRLRNSKPVAPTKEMVSEEVVSDIQGTTEEQKTMPEGIVCYRQDDPIWAADSLGSSEYKMADSGCLTTCITAALNMQGLSELNPGEINKLFSENNVYDNEGNIDWESMESVLGVRVVRKDADETDSSELTELLSKGIYPVVRIRTGLVGHFHYVLLVYGDDGEFYCMDPLNDKKKPVALSRLNSRIYAVRYIERQ